jgi:hypothetical protein
MCSHFLGFRFPVVQVGGGLVVIATGWGHAEAERRE